MDTEIVDVVIVNWNSGGRLLNCVRSIARHDAKWNLVRSVIIVDNNSTDSSLHGCADAYPGRVRILRNPGNLGFGRACNRGASEASGEFLLFLNPDTVLEPNSISGAVATLRKPENADVAICGIKLFDDHGVPGRTCARFPTVLSMIVQTVGLNRLFPRIVPSYVMSEWDHESTARVDHVIGAFYLIRRQVFVSNSGFDSRYFVYMEDLDLSRRVRDAGWQTIYFAEASAYHECGGSSKQIKGTRLFYSLRARLQYCAAHFNRASYHLIAFLTLTVEPVIRICLSAARADLPGLRATIDGYSLLYTRSSGNRREVS